MKFTTRLWRSILRVPLLPPYDVSIVLAVVAAALLHKLIHH
ncbi:hypothetical protein [Bradyrhizobium sp. USDA 4529]